MITRPGARMAHSRVAILALAAVVALLWLAPRTAAAANTVSFWKIYSPGWNLVAAPGGSRLALNGETLLDLDGARARYAQHTDQHARPGNGYWVYYPKGAVLLLIGTPQNVSQVHVDGGSWALLGNSGTMPAAVRGADVALTYEPDRGFAPAGMVQPGQAVLVYADSDADVLLDPYSPPPAVVASIMPAPLSTAPSPPPAFPTAQQAAGVPGEAPVAATPSDEITYLYGLAPLLNDVQALLSHYADNLGLADPARPSDPIWRDLTADADGVAADLAALQSLPVPQRYVTVQADLVASLADISDGMRETVQGLLNGQPDRVALGSGLLAAGARRLVAARARLPM